MIKPGTLDLEGDRWTALLATLQFTGLDLTGAAMEAHVRLKPDTPGTPLISLATVTTTNTQGLRLVSVVTTDGVPTSTVLLQVNETTMEGLPAAPEVGDDVVLSWDMVIANLDATFNPGMTGLKQRYLRGTFTVSPGVTQ